MLRNIKEGVFLSKGYLDSGKYTVFHKARTENGWVWIQDFSFDSLEEAEKEAERESRNNIESKIVDSKGNTVSRYKDMMKREANNYSSNMGVDDIEDIIASGLDWTQDDFSYPEEPKRDYDDASKLITIADAEKIIGERPDASKPKPPTSKNPRPETIKKFKEDVKSYKDRVKKLIEWEKKFDRLVALAQLLKNTEDNLEDLKSDILDWCLRNNGLFIIRKGNKDYKLLRDPVEVVDELSESLGVPEEITSLDEDISWNVENIDFDEDDDIFPSVLITAGKNMIRLISIPDNINEISDIIEPYVEEIQPKDLLSKTNARLDSKSQRVLQGWSEKGLLNSQADPSVHELKIFLASQAFLKEIQQLNDTLFSNKVSDLVNHFLKQI